MRRSLLGLCALLALPVQTVQANATLYGVVDLSLAGFSTEDRGSAINMQSGVQSGSRWGLRGSEDLGDGLSAIYQLESGFLANNGKSAQGGRLFGRAAWLGLSGSLGELRLGRQTSVSSFTLADYDAFLASYLITGAQTALLPFNANRADNTVAWWSPQANGLRVAADYSFDYDSKSGFSTASSNKLASAMLRHDGAGYSLALTYEGAHWAANSGQAQAMRQAGGMRQPYAYTLAGRSEAGPATLYAAASWMRHGSTIPGVVSPGQRVFFPDSSVLGLMAGVSWRFGANTLMASWQASLPQDAGSLQRQGATHNQQIYSLGLVHDLSKRTNVYAIYGHMRGSWETSQWREAQYAVGVRHRF